MRSIVRLVVTVAVLCALPGVGSADDEGSDCEQRFERRVEDLRGDLSGQRISKAAHDEQLAAEHAELKRCEEERLDRARREASDPCAGFDCSHGQVCVADGHLPGCRCREGYRMGLGDEPPCVRVLSPGRYVAAGLVGTVPGLGIGHAIAGLWHDVGYIFTASAVVGASLVAVGLLVMAVGTFATQDDCEKCVPAGQGIMIGGGAIYGAFHLWEMFDIWIRAHKRLESAGDERPFASAGFTLTPFALPTFGANCGGVTAGLGGSF